MKSFFKTIISTFNPNIYGGLVSRSYKRTASHFFLLILFFSIITFVILTPQILGFYNSFNSNLDKLSSLNFEFNAETKEEITLLSNPKIVIDSSRNSTNDEYILITKDTIYKRGVFGYKEYSSSADISSIVKESKIQIIILFLISLPTLFFFHYLINAIKYFAVAMIFALIASIIIKLVDSNVKTKQIINASIYSLSIFVTLKIGLFFNQTLKIYVPIIIYSVWYILVLVLLQDTKIEYTKSKTTHKKRKSSNSNSSPNASADEMAKIEKLINK